MGEPLERALEPDPWRDLLADVQRNVKPFRCREQRQGLRDRLHRARRRAAQVTDHAGGIEPELHGKDPHRGGARVNRAAQVVFPARQSRVNRGHRMKTRLVRLEKPEEIGRGRAGIAVKHRRK